VDAGRAALRQESRPAPLNPNPLEGTKGRAVPTLAKDHPSTVPAAPVWIACTACGRLFPAAPEETTCHDCTPAPITAERGWS